MSCKMAIIDSGVDPPSSFKCKTLPFKCKTLPFEEAMCGNEIGLDLKHSNKFKWLNPINVFASPGKREAGDLDSVSPNLTQKVEKEHEVDHGKVQNSRKHVSKNNRSQFNKFLSSLSNKENVQLDIDSKVDLADDCLSGERSVDTGAFVTDGSHSVDAFSFSLGMKTLGSSMDIAGPSTSTDPPPPPPENSAKDWDPHQAENLLSQSYDLGKPCICMREDGCICCMEDLPSQLKQGTGTDPSLNQTSVTCDNPSMNPESKEKLSKVPFSQTESIVSRVEDTMVCVSPQPLNNNLLEDTSSGPRRKNNKLSDRFICKRRFSPYQGSAVDPRSTEDLFALKRKQSDVDPPKFADVKDTPSSKSCSNMDGSAKKTDTPVNSSQIGNIRLAIGNLSSTVDEEEVVSSSVDKKSSTVDIEPTLILRSDSPVLPLEASESPTIVEQSIQASLSACGDSGPVKEERNERNVVYETEEPTDASSHEGESEPDVTKPANITIGVNAEIIVSSVEDREQTNLPSHSNTDQPVTEEINIGCMLDAALMNGPEDYAPEICSPIAVLDDFATGNESPGDDVDGNFTGQLDQDAYDYDSVDVWQKKGSSPTSLSQSPPLSKTRMSRIPKRRPAKPNEKNLETPLEGLISDDKSLSQMDQSQEKCSKSPRCQESTFQDTFSKCEPKEYTPQMITFSPNKDVKIVSTIPPPVPKKPTRIEKVKTPDLPPWNASTAITKPKKYERPPPLQSKRSELNQASLMALSANCTQSLQNTFRSMNSPATSNSYTSEIDFGKDSPPQKNSSQTSVSRRGTSAPPKQPFRPAGNTYSEKKRFPASNSARCHPELRVPGRRTEVPVVYPSSVQSQAPKVTSRAESTGSTGSESESADQDQYEFYYPDTEHPYCHTVPAVANFTMSPLKNKSNSNMYSFSWQAPKENKHSHFCLSFQTGHDEAFLSYPSIVPKSDGLKFTPPPSSVFRSKEGNMRAPAWSTKARCLGTMRSGRPLPDTQLPQVPPMPQAPYVLPALREDTMAKSPWKVCRPRINPPTVDLSANLRDLPRPRGMGYPK